MCKSKSVVLMQLSASHVFTTIRPSFMCHVGQRIPLRFISVFLLGCVWLGLACIKSEGVQYLVYTLFVLWRLYNRVAVFDSIRDAGFPVQVRAVRRQTCPARMT